MAERTGLEKYKYPFDSKKDLLGESRAVSQFVPHHVDVKFYQTAQFMNSMD